MQNRTYLGDFSDWSEVREQFGGECPEQEPRFVFASYECEGYDGSATVIVSETGIKFSVVEGGHCSCHGLEGQWEPTRHGVRDLRKMMEATYGFWRDQKDDVTKWLHHIRR
jgi:hypothetical protein